MEPISPDIFLANLATATGVGSTLLAQGILMVIAHSLRDPEIIPDWFPQPASMLLVLNHLVWHWIR